MKENQLVISEDGSHTLFSGEFKEHYHSTHGAIRESMHIFIRAGYDFVRPGLSEISLLEIGFGTGLNALLSCTESIENRLPARYTALEPFPVSAECHQKLNFATQLEDPSAQRYLDKLHESGWGEEVEISEWFSITKLQTGIRELPLGAEQYHLVYYDAFSPETQPEMWTEEVFEKLFTHLKPGGCLLTYSCKGIVKRALRAAGFRVYRLPGPPGKREILRAVKPEKSS